MYLPYLLVLVLEAQIAPSQWVHTCEYIKYIWKCTYDAGACLPFLWPPMEFSVYQSMR